MTTTTKATRKPTSDRAQKTRENQQKKRETVEKTIEAANAGDMTARLQLIMFISKAISYHDSGKIEGLHSLDTACANNDFCPKMQKPGTPSCICNWCYTADMWESAIFAHFITGLILSQVELTKEEAAAVAIPALTVRFNSDGELINLTHAVNLIRIAAGHQLTTFTDWTKRLEIMDTAIQQEGKPDNLIIGISSPMINTPARARWEWCDFIFTVYTPEGMKTALARNEHECNGRKCIECKYYCYHHHDTTSGPVHVAEALRKPKGIKKESFPALVAAIDAATLNK